MSHPSPMRSDGDSVSSQPIVPRPPQGGDKTRPVALCKFDEHMMSLVPTYKPMNEEQLRHFLYLSGATEDTMDQCLQAYNRRMEHKIQGVKPAKEPVRYPEGGAGKRVNEGHVGAV